MARLIHHIGMWMVLIFAMIHIYSVVLCVARRALRKVRLDLFRLQILAQAKSRRLVSSNSAPQAAKKSIGVLVLGLGNVLLGDDGLGAAAVARMERDYRIPPGVRLEDGGTLGLSLLGLLADSDRVILVDAVRTDEPPGTLVRLDGEDVMDAVRDRLSPHQVGVADLLDAARLIDCYPSAVTLLGLVPDVIDLAVVRSNAVDAGSMSLSRPLSREVQSLGYKMVREPETCRPASPYSQSHSPFRDVNGEVAEARLPDCWRRARPGRPAASFLRPTVPFATA